MDNEEPTIEDGLWDFYSGLPNPNWYDKTFSDELEDDED